MQRDIFQKIPEVDVFCFCVRLKNAAILIVLYAAFTGMVAQLNIDDIRYQGLCEYNPPSGCGFVQFMYILKYFNAFQGNLVFGASLAYFVGIFINNAITATVFLYVYGVRTLLIAVQGLAWLTLGHTVGGCPMKLNQAVLCVSSIIFSCFCNVYILIVVKSHRTLILKNSGANLVIAQSKKNFFDYVNSK